MYCQALFRCVGGSTVCSAAEEGSIRVRCICRRYSDDLYFGSLDKHLPAKPVRRFDSARCLFGERQIDARPRQRSDPRNEVLTEGLEGLLVRAAPLVPFGARYGVALLATNPFGDGGP
jgi:hypothetical protein